MQQGKEPGHLLALFHGSMVIHQTLASLPPSASARSARERGVEAGVRRHIFSKVLSIVTSFRVENFGPVSSRLRVEDFWCPESAGTSSHLLRRKVLSISDFV